MVPARAAALAALCASGAALAQRPAAPAAPVPVVPALRLPAPSSVLWIGAHPDDEVLAAPLLGRWCLDGKARCAILTVTRGENGSCLLPAGCAPDLATVRSAEAGASSRLFAADLVLLSVPNDAVAAASADERLTEEMTAFVRAFSPELVLTFDPRHGTTCHPDHRAVASIVLKAASRLEAPPAVYLLETSLDVGLAPVTLAFGAATAPAVRFDATTVLAATGRSAWDLGAADMERQPSQFDAAWLAAYRATPAAERAVFLAPASWVLGRPTRVCP